MQRAIKAEFDFSGISRQTTVFHDGDDAFEVLGANLASTEKFLGSAGANLELSEMKGANSLVWRNVDVDQIADYLASMSFHAGNQFFSDMEAFLKWLGEHAQNAGYTKWNVVVAGSAPKQDNCWEISDKAVGLVNRSRLGDRRSDEGVSIGALRDPRDLLADARGLEEDDIPKTGFSNEAVARLRRDGEVGTIPQLLIYLIDKDSKPREPKVVAAPRRARAPLKAKADIVGLSLYLPGSHGKQKNYVTHVTVHVPESFSGAEESLEETVGLIDP
jgi:hypothetical protein